MPISIKRNDIIVYLWYFLLPVLFYGTHYFFNIKPKLLFDLFLFVLLPVSFFAIIYTGKLYNYREFIVFICFFLLLVFVWLIKQTNLIGFYFWAGPQYVGPLIREAKPVFYFLSAALFYGAFRLPTLMSFVKGGALFSVLIICDALANFFLLGDFSQRPYIADESNYDNFLILISLVSLFLIEPKQLWRLFLLFFCRYSRFAIKDGYSDFLCSEWVVFCV